MKFFLVLLFLCLFVISASAAFEEFDVAANSYELNSQSPRREVLAATGLNDHVILKAAANGDTRTVLDILRHDNRLINHQNENGWSSLAFAVANGHYELAKEVRN
jgi:ankyrin repeat protein